jgi:hypothetical protein
MNMPKTSMNEDDGMKTRKDQIGRTWKAPVVKSVPKTKAM